MKQHPYEDIFPDLQRPQQYTGGEWNLPVLPAAGLPRVTLVYPDTYELGMSNYGLTIIRHILLEKGTLDVRRAFSPAPDLHRIITDRRLEWIDLEAGDPVRQSRVIGFGVPCESLFTNVLSLMKLMRLPLRSSDRGEEDPLILLGGGGIVNPLPMAPFADAVFIGEVEAVAEELFGILSSGEDRKERLAAASELPGVFIPSLPGKTVEVQRVPELRSGWVPEKQLVPLSRISQDRAVIEIARGCTRGCRFCQASAISRPVRERPVGEILDLLDRALECTGWEKAGLLSLSFSDYTDLPELLEGSERIGRSRHAVITRPSLRPDTFGRLSGDLKISGRMTLAPEAGSERLRRMMNKPISDRSILDAVESAFGLGAKGLKLYFMIGLPGETMDDVEALAQLALEVGAIARKKGRNPRKSITIALSPFVPKAHTPLQWAPMVPEEELWSRISRVRDLCGKKLTVSWNSPRVSVIEAVLGLGDDHETADVLEEAVNRGAVFDAWADLFRWDIWKELLDEYPTVLSRVLEGSAPGDELPWSFVDSRVSQEFLEKEFQKCMAAEATSDCREAGCVGCGVCDERTVMDPVFAEGAVPSAESEKPAEPIAVLRVRYSRTGLARWSSHLDSVRMWNRAVRRSGLPIAWSRGYVSRPKLQFGPPLPLGMESTAEYVDIHLTAEPSDGMSSMLQNSLPFGFDLVGYEQLPAGTKSPARGVRAAQYRIWPEEGCWPTSISEKIVNSLHDEGMVLKTEVIEDGSLRLLVAAGTRHARPDNLIKPLYSGRIRIRRTDVFVEGPSGLENLGPTTEYRRRNV